MAGLVFATSTIKDIMGLSERLRQRAKIKKQEQGLQALTRGLEAVAVGDATDALHHAKNAQRQLPDVALTRLLSAQASQLSGDSVQATKSFEAMLEAPETEFLGLRGMYLEAQKRGDNASARVYAERAFSLRANADWAFWSVFDLCLERGAWGDARAALDKARRNKLIDGERANRAEAVLLSASAYAADLAQDQNGARKELEQALKLAPSFAPAAVLAARIDHDRGNARKAAKILETAFAADAHPALVHVYADYVGELELAARKTKLEKFAALSPASREAKALLARVHILEENWADAIDALSPALRNAPTAAELSLMASAVGGAHGRDAAEGWLERAAKAPPDPRPGIEGVFHFTREGWSRLVREFMDFGRLAPPPLEEAHNSVSADEIKLLLAPPPAPKPQIVEPEPEEADTPRASDDASASAEDKTVDNGESDTKLEEAASAQSDERDTDDNVSDSGSNAEQTDSDPAQTVPKTAG